MSQQTFRIEDVGPLFGFAHPFSDDRRASRVHLTKDDQEWKRDQFTLERRARLRAMQPPVSG